MQSNTNKTKREATKLKGHQKDRQSTSKNKETKKKRNNQKEHQKTKDIRKPIFYPGFSLTAKNNTAFCAVGPWARCSSWDMAAAPSKAAAHARPTVSCCGPWVQRLCFVFFFGVFCECVSFLFSCFFAFNDHLLCWSTKMDEANLQKQKNIAWAFWKKRECVFLW